MVRREDYLPRPYPGQPPHPTPPPPRRAAGLSIVWRVRIFVVILIVLGLTGMPSPWPLILGCLAYIVFLFPGAVRRSP